MLERYLECTDPDAFLDMPVKPRPTADNGLFKKPVLCPRCLGHGGWHLLLNEYRNTEHPHFDCCCNACNGWGWLSEDQEPYDLWEQRVRAVWQPLIKAVKTVNPAYPNYKGVVVTCKEMVFDPQHPGRDLTCALLHACDGWTVGNFGGLITFIQELPEGYWYTVWVFID